MLGQFPVMKGGTSNDSIHAITTDSNNKFLITGDTAGWVSVSGKEFWILDLAIMNSGIMW